MIHANINTEIHIVNIGQCVVITDKWTVNVESA
jgi:hypothetical protein